LAFESLSEKLGRIFKQLKGRGRLTEADVNYKVVKDFVAKVSEKAVGDDVLESLTPGQQVIKIVNDELIALMGNENAKINFPSKPPCVIMMCGLQGSGKTTHAAKLAKYLLSIGKRPSL
jgi:signal recognition particle subunit SRP54